jgi:hypothetical protein
MYLPTCNLAEDNNVSYFTATEADKRRAEKRQNKY